MLWFSLWGISNLNIILTFIFVFVDTFKSLGAGTDSKYKLDEKYSCKLASRRRRQQEDFIVRCMCYRCNQRLHSMHKTTWVFDWAVHRNRSRHADFPRASINKKKPKSFCGSTYGTGSSGGWYTLV